MTQDVIHAILDLIGNDYSKLLDIVCDSEITYNVSTRNPDTVEFVDVGDGGYVKIRMTGSAIVGSEIPGRPDKTAYEHKQFPMALFVDYEDIKGIHTVDPDGLFNNGDYTADKLSTRNYKVRYDNPLDI